jgi:hypothetical protein
MTGNLQAIGFLLTWVLGWSIGGSLIEAGLSAIDFYPEGLGPAGGAITFVLWSLLWGSSGLWLYQRFTKS